MKIKRVISTFIMLIKLKPSLLLVSIIKIIFNIMSSLLISIWLYKTILDTIFLNKNFKMVCILLALQLAFYFFNYFFEEWYTRSYKPIVNVDLNVHFQLIIKSKCVSIDESDFNKQDYYNKYSWILQHSGSHFIDAFETVVDYINNIIILLLSGGIFFCIEPVLAICSIVCFVITYICDIKTNKVYYMKDRDINLQNRKNEYIKRINYLKDYAQEIRTTNLYKVMDNEFYANYIILDAKYKMYGEKLTKYGIISVLARLLLGTQLPYILIGAKALMTNCYSASDIAVLVGVIQKARTTLNAVVAIYPKLKQNGMYLEDYYNFMDYKPRIVENVNGIRALNKCNGLQIKNLYFQYDKDTPVLKNINMEIKPGEKIAIVGSNGAGKTTLIKLLLRLYIPTGGCIEMDGISAKEYQLSAYRNRFGVAYQESNLYSATVAENVLMDEYTPNKKGIVEEALKNSGISQRIDESPLGFEAIMTKEFDDNGIELSGGQSQKLALSRVFAKDCGVVVLDEPSSALDPISEYEMYKNIMNLSVNKTFIIISHRLSITREVDKIYLMEKGEIVESGSHAELLKLNGQYARMWEVQAERYSSSE